MADVLSVDIAIAGGGVAGSALAIVLRRGGLRVAVVEREPRFRDRVRGDALFPWGAAEAARLGIADILPRSGARPLPVWQRYEDRAPLPPYDWRDDVPGGHVLWGVDHPGLQEALLTLARDEGAHVLRPAQASRPSRLPSGLLSLPITSTGRENATVPAPPVIPAKEGSRPLDANPVGAVGEIHARLVVGADGKDSGARRWIGARTIRDPVHHVLGGCLVADVDLDPDAAHVSRYEGGMTLLFRHGSGRARAYVVTSPEVAAAIRGRGAWDAFRAICAAAFPEGAFSRARAAGPVAFFPAADIYPERIAGDGIVLVGDAAGANDPAQGIGLSLAFRDVRELSQLLLASDDWQAAIEEFARRRPSWYEPLRAYALWQGPLTTDVGPAADAARARAKRAAERDPFRHGYGAIHALGPDGLPVTDEARRHFLGEDLVPPLPLRWERGAGG